MELKSNSEIAADKTVALLTDILGELKEIRNALNRIDSKTFYPVLPIDRQTQGWHGTEVGTVPMDPTVTC